ncbi:unnamed protein product [Ambrosiozyma monospora]|uniref:Unnamed protein product n=1 Tax=Ambrosiozyma monospora TaxID=43982 RepID=A0ACB5TH55_AMBMO|nr:unnamed protein product [Ambrosiozyma monospora]
MSVVDDLEDFLPAIKEELQSLPLAHVSQDSKANNRIPFLLDEINKKIMSTQPTYVDKDKVYQRSAFLFPGDCRIWNKLSVNMSKNVTLCSKRADIVEVSKAYMKDGDLREVQRGLFLSPSLVSGYTALKCCL